MNSLLWMTPSGLVLLLAACATIDTPLPPQLAAPANELKLATVAARGVQIYECKPAADGQAPAWAFVAPEAELFDGAGRRVGHHGAGPFWQATDGSRITGSVKARADAPVPGAIPWLLLATRSTGGSGVYAAVSHVQRVNTHGGVAPASGCSAATRGQTARVDYTADYHLFGPR